MANNNKGYELEVQLTVLAIHSIKPRQSGSFTNDDGDTVEYGYAVKFKTIKVEEVEDKDYGTKEVENVLEIEVPCDTMSETVIVNNHLKAMKASNKPYKIGITMPRVQGTNLTAKTLLHHKDFISEYKV